ncbi:EamA family transporter RarD [Oceanobacillus indicireducens]|uniref:Transporter n=2 Tax=Oceanobacillus TaxID=182709 RepID=A0A918CYW5_9BACI|nr:EamA family transporter RarD [Oceanobacillus indicireducens]GGN50471.1 transporter [Oceanobacillus indicireducens]
MMESREMKLGTLYTFSAYLLWGFLTMYWKLLDHVNPMETLAHRIVWSFIFMIALLLTIKQFRSFLHTCRNLLRNPKDLLAIAAASILISTNWFLFIWAVANGYVLQASLGYYINPLMSIFLGIVVLREQVTMRQGFAFLLCAISVLYLSVSSGVFPWVSLALATSFAIYGLLKKKINISSTHGLTIETMLVTPIAAGYLFLLPRQAFTLSSAISGTNLLLIGAGIATAIPLLLFANGAKAIPLSMVGILQFITPTIMLFLGVFVYHEAFSIEKFIAFLFIWFALILYLSSVYHHPAKRQANT